MKVFAVLLAILAVCAMCGAMSGAPWQWVTAIIAGVVSAECYITAKHEKTE